MLPLRPLTSASLALEQRWTGLVALAFAAALAASAISPAQAQDIVATGSMPDPRTSFPPRADWNFGSWTDGQGGTAIIGQWGAAGQAPNPSSTYSTGPYNIYSGNFNSTFNGQSLRVPSGGSLWIYNTQGTTSTADLILDGGTLRGYEGTTFNPSLTTFDFAGDIEVASDSTIDMSALIRGSALTIRNGALTGSGVLRVNAAEASGAGGPPNKVQFDPNSYSLTNFTGSFAVDAGELSVNESLIPAGVEIDIAPGAIFSMPAGTGGQRPQIGAISGTGTFAFGASFFEIGGGNASGTFNGTLAGTGGVASGQLNKIGTGTFVFNGNGSALSYGTVTAGTLALGTAASLPPNLDVNSGATFAAGTLIPEATIATALQNNWRIFSGAYFGLDTSLGDRTFTLTIVDPPDPANPGNTGTLNFSKIGANTLRMMVAQSYTGTTSIQEGAHIIGLTAALPNYNQAGGFSVEPGAALGVVTALNDQVVAGLLGTGNFQPNSSIAFDTTDGDRNYAVNVIDAASNSGPLGVTKTGTGTLELSGTNTYTGVTGVWDGTLYVDSVVSLPGYNQANKVDVFTGARLVIGNGFTNQNMEDLLGAAQFRENAILGIDTTDANRDYTADIADSSAGGLVIEKVGTGTLSLSGTNTYSGGTTVSGGTLAIASEASLPGFDTNNAYSIATGAQLLLGSGVTNSAVDDILAADNFGANSTLGFDTTGGARSYAGNIANMSAGTLSVTKVGDGLLTLSGTNNYTGTTTIAAGTLSIASTASLPGFDTNARYSVASGASLAIGSSITDEELTDILATGNLQGGAGIGFDTTGGDRTYSGTIADTGSGALLLTKVGTGTLTLSGSNSYTGGTTVGAGTVVIASSGALPGFDQPGDYTVEAGASLAVGNTVTDSEVADMLATGNFDTGSAFGFDTSAGDRTYSAALTDPTGVNLGLVKVGSNTLTVSGTNTYSGGTTITAGTLEIASGSSLPNSGTNGSFSVASGARLTVADSVTNADVDGILGTNNFQAGSEFAFDTTAGDRTYSSAIADPSGASIEIVKEGTGTLSLTGTNTYSGGTTVASGTLAIDSAASLPGFNTNGAYSVASGATLAVGNNVTDAAITDILGTTNLAAGASLGFDTGANDRSYTAVIANTAQGALGLVKDGTGTLTLSGTNTYSGGTNVTAGTIAIASAASLPGYNTNGAYSVAAGGTMAVGNAVTDSEISAMLGTTNFQAGAVLGFDTASGDRSYTAAIADTAQGSLGLTKTGTDALTLSGTSTYTGPTTVEDGDLFINGSLSNTSSVSVVGGLLGGTGSIASGLSVGGAGTLSPGDAASPIGAFAAGATTLSSGATFGFEVDSTDPNNVATAADLMVVNGGLNIASGSILDFTDIASTVNPFLDQTTFALINYSGTWDGGLFSFGGSSLADGARFFVGGQEWQIDYDSPTGGANFTGDYVSPGSFVTVTAITAVPEPATLGLLAAATGCGALLLRRKARRA